MAREYYLISKNYGQKFTRYKGNAIRLSQQLPDLVDEVVIGIKGKIGQEKRITTFKDSQGNILERIFDYFDKPLKNQIYARENFTKGNNLFTTTTITEYSLKRKDLSTYKTLRKTFEEFNIPTTMWNKIKIENNHLYKNINSGEKIFSQTSVTNIKQPTEQIHSFIEFPHLVNGKRKNNSKKILEIKVNSKQGLVTETLTQQGAKKPKNDSFLAFRALDFEEIKTTLTEIFLRKRGLSKKMNISIDPAYQPPGEGIYRISAEFNPFYGEIHFNKFFKFKSKQKLVSTSRHEVEHAWQYYLYSRNTGGEYPWEISTAKIFGGIQKNSKLKKEAEKYTKSINNYVTYLEDYEKYQKNYIEIKANNAGRKARNKYEREAQEIRNAFPFIPEEML